jgi:protein-S-isoprenylcysteine O-methyltransferase Ste14
MHHICARIIAIAWVAFALVWLFASFSSKQNARKQTSSPRIAQMLLVIAAYFLLFDSETAIGPLGWRFVPDTSLWWISGAALVVAGILVSFWARFFLGGNWSATVTVKQDHELVRSGPYAIVRHPIYSGLLRPLRALRSIREKSEGCSRCFWPLWLGNGSRCWKKLSCRSNSETTITSTGGRLRL